MTLSAYVQGVGVLGPGLSGWPAAAAVLAGREAYQSRSTVVPAPAMLPAAERRRTGRVVKVALAAASEAVSAAGVDPGDLPSVFVSSGSDGDICHEICQALALPGREVSPTRFSNSVHNAPAGNWSIGTGSTSPASVLCAFDASFGAGLLDAMSQVAADQRTILLVAYDTEYPPPLRAKRPIPDAFGVALVLAPQPRAGALARLDVCLSTDAFAPMAQPELENLRASVPAARSLPLLELLAADAAGRTTIEYLTDSRLAVEVLACR